MSWSFVALALCGFALFHVLKPFVLRAIARRTKNVTIVRFVRRLGYMAACLVLLGIVLLPEKKHLGPTVFCGALSVLFAFLTMWPDYIKSSEEFFQDGSEDTD